VKDDLHRQLGLSRAEELLLHLPLRYEDETRLTPFARLHSGLTAQTEGRITHAETQRGGSLLFDLEDEAGNSLRIRLLHTRPNQRNALSLGARVRVFGEARPGLYGLEMVHPRYRICTAATRLPTTLTPVYPSVAAVPQYKLRLAIDALLAEVDLSDTVPEALRPNLPEFAASLRFLHHPPPNADTALLEARLGPAWARLKLDELLAQQLSLHLSAQQRDHLQAPILIDADGLAERLTREFPFSLTAAQARCIDEIRHDLAQDHPMHRLLQGDVGSGKTCVAAAVSAIAVGSGAQVAVMAPTELLAEQLAQKFIHWFTPLGIPVATLTAAVKGRARTAQLAALREGTARIAVGTHALFQDEVIFQNLQLVIVDEQHRFGVEQRLALRQKGAFDHTPHLLMMSATPIPRSLAMSYFADLAVSSIDTLPPGRTAIDTRVMSSAKRDEIILRLRAFCRGDAHTGGQAYWVCPLIEESEKLDLKAAIDAHAEISAALPEIEVGLAHGRMKATEKAAVMAAFKAGEIDILVATTVIEVGVDVPNASLMVIEHAERMGLAQLHQLRGRVGRGARASICVLLYSQPLGAIARERLNIIKNSQDGFEIARHDLRLRGPGERLGAKQSGAHLLRFADIEADSGLLQQASDIATVMLDTQPDAVERHLARWLSGGVERLNA